MIKFDMLRYYETDHAPVSFIDPYLRNAAETISHARIHEALTRLVVSRSTVSATSLVRPWALQKRHDVVSVGVCVRRSAAWSIGFISSRGRSLSFV